MYFESFNEFLAMGGHGLYVWLSYGIFGAVIAWNILTLRLNRSLCIKKARKTWTREKSRESTHESNEQKTAEDSSL